MFYQNILVATDGSEPSMKGVDRAIALAKAGGARLTAVHVSEPYPTFDLATSLGYFLNEAEVSKYYETVDKLAGQILSKVEAKAVSEGLKIETRHLQKTKPAEGILKVADEQECDLIVIASKGLTGIERLVMGSVASKVANSSKVSVLVAR